MFSNLTTQGRIWILLIAWGLFAGLCVADTFDLSDDIAWPTAAGQPAVAPDSPEEQKPYAFVRFVRDGFLYRSDIEPLSLRLGSDRATLFSSPFPCSDMPLYQRHSVYRI
jgi:hypothetical protein